MATILFLEEAIDISVRNRIPTTTDGRPMQVDFPTPPAAESEPDAPTNAVAIFHPRGSALAAPELTHPGESQPNRLAERIVEAIAG